MREGEELSNDNQDFHELCLNNAVGKKHNCDCSFLVYRKTGDLGFF